MNNKRVQVLAILMVFAAVQLSMAGFQAGRNVHEKSDAKLQVTVGSLTELTGDVQETTRTYYEATGRFEDQADRESYSFEDFGMDGGYPTIGIAFENAGKYFTFQLDVSIAMPDVSSVAIRNYYIGVSDISFNGVGYDYMAIPEGTPFTVDLVTGVIEMRGLFTPFTISAGDSFEFTPFISAGIFGLVSQYDIDAGPAQGIKQYLDPPEDFVVGGQADGILAGGFPELGIGAELRFGKPDKLNLVLRASYAGFQFSGDTGIFTSAEHRNKDIELDHMNMEASACIEMPVFKNRCLTLGIEYQTIESEAKITSKEFTTEEIIDRHERFNKDAEFGLTSVAAKLGITF